MNSESIALCTSKSMSVLRTVLTCLVKVIRVRGRLLESILFRLLMTLSTYEPLGLPFLVFLSSSRRLLIREHDMPFLFKNRISGSNPVSFDNTINF